MNWDAIGAVGEIVGALAVVASLGYLASQIRIQNRESRLSAMHDIAVGFRDTLATIADEGIAELLDKSIEDYSSLSQAETLRIIAVVGRVLRVWEEAYLLYEAGRLDDRMWQPMLRQFNGYLSVTGFAKVWALRKQYFDNGFREFVDNMEREEYVFELPADA